MFSKYRLVLAVALCALVCTSMLANNLIVLPASQGTSTVDGIVFDGLTLQRTSTTFTSPDRPLAVFSRPTLLPADVRYYVVAKTGSLLVLDKDFKAIGNPISIGQDVRGAAMSPDGRRLMVTYSQTNSKVFNAADGTEIQSQFIDVGLDPGDVVFSPDSKRAFVLSFRAQRLTAVDMEPTPRAAGSVPLAGTSDSTQGALSIGPNGFVYVTVDSRVLEIDPRGASINAASVRRQFNLPPSARVGKLAFTPDGTRALAANLTGATSGELFYFFHLDLTNGNNATATVRNTDGLSGLTFDKVYVTSNSRAYAVTARAATKQRALYELTLPASGTIAPFEAPTIKDAFFASKGNIDVTDSIALSDEYPSAFRMYVSSPLNQITSLAQNTVYVVDLAASNPTVLRDLPFTSLPEFIAWVSPASTIERNDRIGGREAINARQPNPPAGGTTLPFGVRVINTSGRPMFNVPVIFTASAGGSIEGLQTINTNADGIALAVAKAPATQGEFTVLASVGGSNLSQTFVFTAGTPSSGGGTGGGGSGTSGGIAIVTGDGQVIREGNPSRDVRVRVTDGAGKPVSGATVQWAVTQGRGRWRDGSSTVDAPDKRETITDQKGESVNVYFAETVTFGTAFLEGIATASSGGSTVTIYTTTIPSSINGLSAVDPSVRFLAPTSEPRIIRGKAGETIAGAIRFLIQNANEFQNGMVLKNVGLELETVLPGEEKPAETPSAACSPKPVPLSDEKGVINCDLKLTGRASTSTLRAMIGGRNVFPITLIIEPGDPAQVVITSGDKQSADPDSVLPGQLRVRIVDGGGNGLAGVTVRWEIIQGQGSFGSGFTTTTDLNGQAFNTLRLGQNPGTVLVRVTALSGVLPFPTATFEASVNVRAGSLNKVSGDNQTTFTGSSFAQPLIVQVLDTRGQPIGNQTVEWAVLEGSATISSATSQSDATGRASITVRSGAQAGAVRVRAQLPNIASATQVFALTTQLPGPQINALDFFNGASNERGAVVPGSIYTIVGTGLAPDVRGCQVSSSLVGTLPTRLAGVEVQFGSTLAPIFNVCNQSGRETVTVQVPFDLAPGGNVAVTVRVNAGSSVINGVQVTDLQPGTFETVDNQGRRYAVAIKPNGSYVTPENPARWGEIIRFFATGLGQVQPNASTGSTGVPSQNVIAPVVVGLNDAGARLVSATYAVGQVGVYEIAMEIPQGTATGPARPLGLLMTRSNGQTATPGNAPTIALSQ